MGISRKPLGQLDQHEVIKHVYNPENATLSVDGFLTGKVGNKVAVAVTQTTVPGDTEVYTFSDTSGTLFVLTIVYTDATLETMISAERTA